MHFYGPSKQKQPFTANIKLGRARTLFKITLIVFFWEKNVIYTKDG